VAGLIILVSASPAVAMNHRASTAAMQVTPQNTAVATGLSPRSGFAGAAAGEPDGAAGVIIPFPACRS
jgi:hypothetical protein